MENLDEKELMEAERAQTFDAKRYTKALTNHMMRTFQGQFEELRDQISNLAMSHDTPIRRTNRQPRRQNMNRRAKNNDEESVSEEYDDEERYSDTNQRRDRFQQRGNEYGEDDNLGSIKMTIPSFQGSNDPETYIEWERKVCVVFDCHRYSYLKKVKLASSEFGGYAAVWWEQLNVYRRKNRMRPVKSWEERKEAMRKRFVPSHYARDLYRELQLISQGSRTLDEFYKEMEIIMIRANIEE